MLIDPASVGKVCFRIGLAITLSCLVGVAACTEATEPHEGVAHSPPATAPAPETTLDSLGLWVGDATGWVLPSIEDETIRANVQTKIAELGDHIAARRYDLTRQNIAALRDIMNSVSTELASALGPLDVALKVIELELDQPAT